MRSTNVIYLDYQATTPCDPQVVEAMNPYWSEQFANPASRSHRFGRSANAAVERAREQVARLINASAKEIIWTSGATEANNLALFGATKPSGNLRPHIISVRTEHASILDPLAKLAEEGCDITLLEVDRNGRIELARLKQTINDRTTLVSVMSANNEIGVLQDLSNIGKLCREAGVCFHTDAAQACGKIPIDVREMNIDLLSISAHKMYGPKGIGALFVRRGRPKIRLSPQILGGGHERGLRSGTLAVPLIVGFGTAAKLADDELTTGRIEVLSALRNHFWTSLSEAIKGVHLNGPVDGRLPTNLNVSFDGIDSETLLVSLPRLAISTGSACSSATLKPSHVLTAMGLDSERVHGSIRLGIGRFTTESDIETAVQWIASSVKRIREESAIEIGSLTRRDSELVTEEPSRLPGENKDP